ncbi:MAG: hypothetical protein ACUVXG_08715 [Anaerolineae bacterium]
MPKQPAIIQTLRKLGQQPVRLIVRTVGSPQDHLPEIEQQGLKVHQVFRLVRAVSIEGPASAALTLVGRDWVKAIEEDKEVHTQSTPPGGASR